MIQDEDRAGMADKYHVDLWKHATELFRLHQWQQAADIFEFLSKDVSSVKERTKCLVNQALIQARLGNYQEASSALAAAAELGVDLAITAFVAGLVSCELGYLTLAESWFEACLDGLNGNDVDYANGGMDFVLAFASVQRNFDSVNQAYLARESGVQDATPEDLVYLPAELLFEAPPRSEQISRVEGVAPLTVPKKILRETLQSDAVSSRQGDAGAVYSPVPSSIYSVGSDQQASLGPPFLDEVLRSPTKISADVKDSSHVGYRTSAKHKHAFVIIDHTKTPNAATRPLPRTEVDNKIRALPRTHPRDATTHDDKASAQPLSLQGSRRFPHTWHGRQRPRYEPRDARAVSDSTRDLARFVRVFAPEIPQADREILAKVARIKVARDAEQAASAEAAAKEYERLAMRLGVLPDTEQEARFSAERQRRAERGSKERARTRAATALAGTIHLLGGRHRPSRIRWPFQDDDMALEQGTSSAPLKPEPLDFIMGADGKTKIISKAPQHTPAARQARPPSTARAWPGVGHPATESLATSLSPPSRSTPAMARPQDVAGPLLQPTAYEAPSWGKLRAVQAPHAAPPSARMPARPGATATSFRSRRRQTDNHFAVPPPLHALPPTAGQPAPPSASDGGGDDDVRSTSLYSPSVVSSLHMWDYITGHNHPSNVRKRGRR